MRNIAIGLLLVILVSIVVEPLVELANVVKEEIMLSTAISNACRAAKDRSLEYELLRGLDAEVDEDKFKEYFADAFENALNVTEKTHAGNTLTFTSDDGKFNTFTVTLDFDDSTNWQTEQLETSVEIKAAAKYKFKTKYLKLAEDAIRGDDYQLMSERKFLLSVRN